MLIDVLDLKVHFDNEQYGYDEVVSIDRCKTVNRFEHVTIDKVLLMFHQSNHFEVYELMMSDGKDRQ